MFFKKSYQSAVAISTVMLLLLFSHSIQDRPSKNEDKKVLDSVEDERKYPTPMAKSPLLPLLLLSLAKQKHTPKTVTKFRKEYDYIIVGGGTAGSVLAGRLSEVPCVSILVLEAGKSPPRLTEVPLFSQAFWNTDLDWKYTSVPQKHTGSALNDRKIPWNAGKAVGGSSILAAMLSVRGNHQNYDDWAAMGAVGWDYESVLPYFRKLETNPFYPNSRYHGTHGPMMHEKPNYEAEIKAPVISASEAMGHFLNDPDGATQPGLYDLLLNTKNGQKCSTSKAYLVPNEDKKNLDILPNAMVKKIIIKNRRATGVNFNYRGRERVVRARREVILTAGTVNSAQLLMLSGIGPKCELDKFDIPVVADLPVGLNLQDHCSSTMEFVVDDRIMKFTDKVSSNRNILDYIFSRKGPLTTSEALVMADFVRNKNSKSKKIPDQEVYFAEFDTDAPKTLLNMKKEYHDQIYGPYENKTTFVCISQLLHPRSRGTVRLNSSDVNDQPLINPNYFSDPRDLEDVLNGLKHCSKIGESAPLKKIGAKRFETLFPGCEDESGDDYLRCTLRSFVLSARHEVGTARMGNPKDPATVVDPKLRVKSIRGLRVADASVMPLIPYANTHQPTAMIAEKAAEIIKGTIVCSSDSSGSTSRCGGKCDRGRCSDIIDIERERTYKTPAQNSPLLPFLLSSLSRQKHSPDTVSEFKQQYDYIIIGAGTAGSVIAGRLSEISCVDILLLEAGKPPPMVTEVPAYARSFLGSDIDWKYITVPQKYTGEGLVNRQMTLPSGKAIGGSSIINSMVNVRGNKKNYDDWAAMGAVGWDYENVLPYFKKMESNQDKDYVKTRYHGADGPLTIDRPKYTGEIKHPLIKAFENEGIHLGDPNGAKQTVLYDFQLNSRNGQRCSFAKAYLVPNDHLPNLHILPNAMVKKIVIDERRATAVQFDYDGRQHEVKAKREVILTAGAIRSTQLLMLSGIGPAKELKKFGIPVVANLKVGYNLQDQISTIQDFVLDEKIDSFADKINDPVNTLRYLHNRTGPLTNGNAYAVLAFMPNEESTADDIADVQIGYQESSIRQALEVNNMKQNYYDQVFLPYEDKPTFDCRVQLLHPWSRGTVRLNSSDPYDPPIIDPRYLEDSRDLDRLVDGVKQCRRFVESEPMRRIGAKRFETLFPGCEQYADLEDDYLRCMARVYGLSSYHFVGTAKMGDPQDESTVVDPELRVKSIQGLRVADASVMPLLPDANTNIPTGMVAEKAADIIKSSIDCFCSR